MHDSVYRLSVAFQNTAYNQCTQTGFYIGPEMDKPPVPNTEYVRGINIPEFTEDIDEIQHLMYTMYQILYKTIDILCKLGKKTITLLTFCKKQVRIQKNNMEDYA